MGVTRYSDGTTTITLGGAVEAHVRKLILAMHGGVVEVLEREAEAVRAKAEADWYTQVTRRTGKSGNIEVVTTVTPTEIRVAIGSTDLAKAKYVHRPGPLSQITRKAKGADFASGKALASPPGKRISGRGVVTEDNPKASDGKFLLQELIGKPARKMIKRLQNLLPAEMDAQVRKGRSG